MINKAELLIVKRYLRPKSKDSFLKIISNFSFIGIMLGVATLIIVMSVMNGFRIDLIDKLLKYQPHISFESKGNYDEEKKYIQKKAEDNNFKILSINLVNNSQALIVTKNNNTGVLIKGFKINELKNNYFLKNSIIEGNINEESIGIGIELASKLSLNIGDQITLLSNSKETTPFGVIPSQFTFKVGYIFSTGMYEFDSNFLIVNLNQASLLTKNKNEIELRVSAPDKANEFVNLLKKQNSNYLIYSWVDNNKTFFDALVVERNVMFIILTLIIIVAAFNIISVLTILIKNKSKEISVLRSMGFHKNSILRIFLITGSYIGFIGTLLGVFFGVLISIYLEDIRQLLNIYLNINIFPSEIYFLSQLPTHINFNSIFLISLSSICIVFLACLFPSLSASKLDPVKYLKNE